jgi:septal ring factor EnvC (AmiA/AmiB activator)
MSRKKYFYNPHTLQFEEFKIPLKKRFYSSLGLACAIIVSGFCMYCVTYAFFPSQKEKALLREIDQMKYEYDVVSTHLDQISDKLDHIHHKDNDLHRLVLGMDPIDSTVWEAGVGGHERYASLMQFPHGGELMTQTRKRVGQLERQMEMQARSLDSISIMAKLKEEKLASVPSIKPVRVDLLKRDVTLLSGFGIRVHPVHKVPRMHTGLDFTAPAGTAIQATGNGTVSSIKRSSSGYGHHIMINHGFGYETLYAHLSESYVKVGERVTKGQQIGLVGSTGTSTAPHCHYEVHYNGSPVDPIHYCLDGLTPQQYKYLVDQASLANQSFD